MTPLTFATYSRHVPPPLCYTLPPHVLHPPTPPATCSCHVSTTRSHHVPPSSPLPRVTTTCSHHMFPPHVLPHVKATCSHHMFCLPVTACSHAPLPSMHDSMTSSLCSQSFIPIGVVMHCLRLLSDEEQPRSSSHICPVAGKYLCREMQDKSHQCLRTAKGQ